MEPGRSQLLKKTAIACGATVLLLAAFAGWRERERRDLLSSLQIRVLAQGASLHIETKKRSVFGDSTYTARLALRGELSIAIDRATMRQPLLTSGTVEVDGAQFVLRGAPTTFWEQWTKTNAWRDLPITFVNSRVDYADRSVGHVSLAGTRVTHRAEEQIVRAAQLTFNGMRWSDVTLALSHPRTVLRVGLGEAGQVAPQIELRYIPSHGNAAEWALNVPSQPLGLLLARLGAGGVRAADKSRVAGTLSVIVFDDAAKSSRANLALVVDNWFVPIWPEASAFTGKSGSLGARLEPTSDNRTWKITRVEVGAAIFSLTGTGTLTLGEPCRLNLQAKGTRNCAQLAAHLPASAYREKVKRFIEQANRSPASLKTAEEQTVELRLSIDVTMGAGGYSNFDWHLAAGCGLDELSGPGELGGS